MLYQEDSYSMAQKISTHVILDGLCRKKCLICMRMMVEEADSEQAVGASGWSELRDCRSAERSPAWTREHCMCGCCSKCCITPQKNGELCIHPWRKGWKEKELERKKEGKSDPQHTEIHSWRYKETRHSIPSLLTTVESITHSGLLLSYQSFGRRPETPHWDTR